MLIVENLPLHGLLPPPRFKGNRHASMIEYIEIA
jgi:hypothetical protein